MSPNIVYLLYTLVTSWTSYQEYEQYISYKIRGYVPGEHPTMTAEQISSQSWMTQTLRLPRTILVVSAYLAKVVEKVVPPQPAAEVVRTL